MTSRLVIHADDLGETAEITKGILECVDAGRVTSTSLMANMPATEMAIEEAARRGKSASFGVHLVLCEGPPLTRPKSLTGSDGEFLPKKKLGLKGLAGRLDAEDVEQELRAQIERIAAGGVQISHFDSHKHLHQLPVVRDVVVRLAKEFGVERIRCTLERGFWPKGMKPGAWLSRSVRVHLAEQASGRFRGRGLRHPDRVFDVRELIAERGERERQLARMRYPDGISEMVCHPGTYQADLDKPGSCARFAELEFLLDDAFGELVTAADAELVTFWGGLMSARILMLIPQAFYTTRGTPLSAYHRTKELVRLGYHVDIMTYPIGEAPPDLPDTKVYRSWGPHFVSQIKQGPTKIKIWFDALFALTLFFVLLRNRYDMMYAHEEGGFIAAWFGKIFRIPYVYDMHSSLPLQIKEWEFSKSTLVIGFFEWVERFTVRNARVNVSIAPGVTKAALDAVPDATVVTILNRFALEERPSDEVAQQIRDRHGVPAERKLIVYTGSYVPLQALDMLIAGVPRVLDAHPDAHFLLVGGKPEQIAEHQQWVDEAGVAERVDLIEARPQSEMPAYMAAADVLVSPRIRGINPPGKLFSYLNSGKPVVACDTLVHNQILDESCSILTPPTAEGFADGVIQALDPEVAARVTAGAAEILETKYSEAAREEAYKELVDAMKA